MKVTGVTADLVLGMEALMLSVLKHAAMALRHTRHCSPSSESLKTLGSLKDSCQVRAHDERMDVCVRVRTRSHL